MRMQCVGTGFAHSFALILQCLQHRQLQIGRKLASASRSAAAYRTSGAGYAAKRPATS